MADKLIRFKCAVCKAPVARLASVMRRPGFELRLRCDKCWKA